MCFCNCISSVANLAICIKHAAFQKWSTTSKLATLCNFRLLFFRLVFLFQVVKMPNCDHSCCKDCATKHFTILVKDRNISEATCPFCQEPTGLADDDDLAANYFAKLDVLLKPLVEQDVHDLFQRKLRDRTLMKDPNFKWCYKVSEVSLEVHKSDKINVRLICVQG